MTSMSLSFASAAFQREMRLKAVAVDRASQWALRQGAREVQRAARKKVRVYKGANRVSSAQARKVYRAGGSVASGTVVAGLLRDSIRPSRSIIRQGSTMVLRVSPRGARAHLYAQKIEDLDHFMQAGRDAGDAAMSTILAGAVGRVLR